MATHKRGILLGMLLGDGCLKVKTHKCLDGSVSKYYEFVICHSTKQEAYLKYKLDLFHSIVGGKLPSVNYENIKGKYESCRFSKCHKIFRLFHKTLYSNNDKKYFSEKVFRYLTPQSIALWYMDDGGVSKTMHNKKVSSIEMRLYTYFSEEEADRSIEYFKSVHGIYAKKRHYMKRNQWNLVFNSKESVKFESLIGTHIIPEMLYKLPSYYFTRALDTTKDGGDDIV
jgi:recombination protein RecA